MQDSCKRFPVYQENYNSYNGYENCDSGYNGYSTQDYSANDWRYYNSTNNYYGQGYDTNYSYNQHQYQQTYQESVHANTNGYNVCVNDYSVANCAYPAPHTHNSYVPSSHPSFTSEENSLEGYHWDGVS